MSALFTGSLLCLRVLWIQQQLEIEWCQRSFTRISEPVAIPQSDEFTGQSLEVLSCQLAGQFIHCHYFFC